MKIFFVFIILFTFSFIYSCNNANENSISLQQKIDSLQKQISNSYKPGLGEFMSSIQVHHAKLWFAGTNENWKLADFEIHEIIEAVDDIQQYNTDRAESKDIVMLKPALDSIVHAIDAQNESLFEADFVLLTNTCNNCHKAVNFDFNVVKIPDAPPFSNQEFKKK